MERPGGEKVDGDVLLWDAGLRDREGGDKSLVDRGAGEVAVRAG